MNHMEDITIVHIVDYDRKYTLCGRLALSVKATDPITLVDLLTPNERYCHVCEKDPRIPLILLGKVDL